MENGFTPLEVKEKTSDKGKKLKLLTGFTPLEVKEKTSDKGKKLKLLTGFTLVEVFIAIIILFVGVVGVFSLIVSSISASGDSVDTFIASQLAAEGVEIVRNLRDQNWLNLTDWMSGLQACQAGCERDYNDLSFSPYGNNFLKITSNGFYNYGTGQASKFKRLITITPQAEYLEVKVKVMWQDKSFAVVDHLYNWLIY